MIPTSAILRRLLYAACVAVLGCAAASHGQTPIHLQRPFDRVSLNEAGGGAVYEVEPLPLAGRRVPDPFPSGDLKVRLAENPAEEYEIRWSDIARIDLFEQLVLREAVRLIQEKEFDDAFNTLGRLHADYPETPGLERATATFLQGNALAVFREGQFDRALAILGSLHELDPSFNGLARAIDAVGEKMIEERVAKRDLRGARAVLRVVDAQFKDQPITFADRWRTRFRRAAEDQLAKSEALLADGDYRAARVAAIEALTIAPDFARAAQLVTTIQRRNPTVLVGVRTAAPSPLAPRIDVPASLRTGYAAAPSLTRIADYSPEGGIYSSPIGVVGLNATGSEMSLTVLDYPAGSPAALGAPSSVARWLLSAADPDHPNHSPALAEVVGAVLTPEPDLLVVGLSRSHVRPEALLQEAMLAECGLPAPRGTYRARRLDDETVELKAVAAGAGVSVIEERRINSDDEAATLLATGEIDVLARVAPWQAAALRANRDLVVGQYRLPTVHVLIPTHRHKLLNNRVFRRALCYGIDRQRILDELITGGANLPGFKVVSGPFPVGVSLSDPVRYGYHDGVEPRPYEPRLGALLAALAWTNVQAAARQESREGDASTEAGEGGEPQADEPFPKMRLAHSADPVARAACQAIRLQLKPLGIPVELVELTPAELVDPDGDFELRYAELATWEPVVDAKRLLGQGGLAGRCSGPMFAALQRLDEARNWNAALETLHDIHELAAGDLPVIPLWQTVNYYAHRRDLSGLPATTIHLYQSLADWRKEPSPDIR